MKPFLSYLLLFLISSANAENMDIKTISTIIQKLEKASSVDSQQIKSNDLLLRIADLYSERARLIFIKKQENQCNNCGSEITDKKRAISLYEFVYKKSGWENMGSSAIQLAHLYRSQNNNTKAINVLKPIIKSNKRKFSDLRNFANKLLGEIYFAKGDYKTSLQYLNKSFKTSSKDGEILYKIAWCEFYIGKTLQAKNTLIKILKSELLLSHLNKIDDTFHDVVVKDLAVFMAKQSVNNEEISSFVDLQPQKTKIDNVFFFGHELIRLGKFKESLLVWDYILQNKSLPKDKLTALHFYIAKSHLELGNSKKAKNHFLTAISEWETRPCPESNSDCSNLKNEMRNWLIQWSNANAKNLNQNIAIAFTSFYALFSNDLNLGLRSYQIAKRLQSWENADKILQTLIAKAKNKNDKIYNLALSERVKNSEASKNQQLMTQAYVFYLRNSPKNSYYLSVLYQKSYQDYEMKKYDLAQHGFEEIINSKEKGIDNLKIKSADLVIKIVTEHSGDEDVKTKSLELAKKIKQREKEFYNLYLLAMVKIGKSKAQEKKASIDQDFYEEIKHAKLNILNKKLKVDVLMTQLALAQKYELYSEQERLAQSILKFKNLTKDQKKILYSTLLLSYEAQLKFLKAYVVLDKMKDQFPDKQAFELRKTFFAKLSGKNYSKHLLNILKKSKSKSQRRFALLNLVKTKRNPWKLITQYKHILNSKNLASEEILFYASLNKWNKKYLNKFKFLIRNPTSYYGSYVKRKLYTQDVSSQIYRMNKVKLISKSNYLMKKTLNKKLIELEKTEKLLQNSTIKNDWILGAIVLKSVADVNYEIYEFINKQPIPKNTDIKFYKKSLARQTKIFFNKKVVFENKLKSYWNDTSFIDNLISFYDDLATKDRHKVADELNLLLKMSPKKFAHQVRHQLNDLTQNNKNTTLAEAWTKLTINPFAVKQIENLISLEKLRGNNITVAYLNLRIANARKMEQENL